jgi:tetratricopeptide (TPR) repeat protein
MVRCSGTGGISQQLTGRDGKFYFRVSPGNYDVTVHAPGYIEGAQSITLTDFNASEYMAIRLRPEARTTKTGSPSVVEANVPSEAQKEFDKAEAAIATGKKEAVEEAVRHYQRATSIYPKFVQAQLKLGTAYMDLGEWDKAEQALKKTLEIDPKAVNALFALGEIYLRQKKGEEAEKVLLQGLQTEDRSFQGHLTLARVYFDMASKNKDEAQARPSLEKAYDQVNQALKLNPDMAQAHLVKGNLLLRVRRAADAQHEFEEYLRLDPKGPAAEQTRIIVEKIKKALESEKKP